MTLALLCPGQGSQHVGMGRDFYEAFGVARRIFDDANKELGFNLTRLCFEGPEDQLNATDVAQVAIFVTSVAIYETLLELGRVPNAPVLAAGLSLGEYTALHLAGVTTYRDSLHVVRERGKLMQAAAEAAASTMVAITGGDEATVEAIVKEAGAGGILVAANYNLPGQIVLSGSIEACARAVEAADAKGVRATPLKVAGAFHSPFMQNAAECMEKVLSDVPFSQPRMPVISNVTAKPHGSGLETKALLVQQVVAPVRWYQSIGYLQQQGVTEFLEVGPGRVLTGLMKRIDRKAAIKNVSTTDGLSQVAV